MGVIKSVTPIDEAMEEKMWANGILGEHNPNQLLETVLYLIRVNFSLRGGTEHE